MITDFFKSFLEVFACVQVTTMVTTVNFLLAYLAFKLPLKWSTPIVGLYSAWYLWDYQTPFRAGRHHRFVRNFFLWKYLASYFPVKLHKTIDMDPNKNYIFTFHPHGFFAYGALTAFCTNSCGFDDLFPDLTVHFIVLNGQFRFPFYRDYLISFGFGSANPESLDYKLTKLGPGHSIWLAVGGNAEMLLFDHSSYTLKIKSRKGFIRRALKTGANIVPVFSFNEHRLYDIYSAEKGSIAHYLEKVVKFLLKIELPTHIYGRWRWAMYAVPKKLPVNIVVGEPIDFNKLFNEPYGKDAPEDLVDKCHEFYLKALRKLYDEHKARFGDEDTPLIFV